jgi:1,4-dihydroxy-2-naphthoate octaprenyltransferase
MCARRGLFVHWCQDVASYVCYIFVLLLHLGSWIYLISLVVIMPTHHSLSLEGQERTSVSDESYSSMSITAGIVSTCDDGPHSYP